MVDVATHHASDCGRPLRELPETQDGAEDVVEVVCDAASEGPNRLQLLRLSQLNLEAFFLGCRFPVRGDVDRRADEAHDGAARRIAHTAASGLQPVPLAIGMANPVLRLVVIRMSLDMIAQRVFHDLYVVRVHFESGKPRLPRGYGRIFRPPVQQLHLRRQKSGSAFEIPIEVAFLRSFHGEGISLFALAQGPFAFFNAAQLVQEHVDGECAKQHEDERACDNPVRFGTPTLEGDRPYTRHGHDQREVLHAREPDQPR